MNLIKVIKQCSVKDIKKMRREATNYEKIIIKDINRHLIKKIYRQQMIIWHQGIAKHHFSLGICSLKQRDAVVHPLEWPNSNTEHTKCWRGHGAILRDSHSLMVGIQNDTDTLKDGLAIFFIKLNILLFYDPAITLLAMEPSELQTCPQKTPAHRGMAALLITKSLEAAKMSFKKW